jgi:hypothetical protein
MLDPALSGYYAAKARQPNPSSRAVREQSLLQEFRWVYQASYRIYGAGTV